MIACNITVALEDSKSVLCEGFNLCLCALLSLSLPPSLSLSLFAVKALMELDQKLARDEAKIKETLPARLVLKTSLGH